MPSIAEVDLIGSGITTTPIPGIPYNRLNHGCGRDDLAKAVAAWNARYPAGSVDARGQAIPRLVLPPNYSLGHSFNSQDSRVTKNSAFKERYKFSVFVEMFNLFNVADLGAFGQSTNRAGQVFGSGGPRAVQLGIRFQF